MPGISDFLASPLKHRFCYWDSTCIYHTLSRLSGFPRKSKWKSPLLFQSFIIHGFIASITCMMPVSPTSWISFRSVDKGCRFFSMSLIQSGEMPFYVTLARFSSSKKKKTFKHFCCCCCFIAMVVLMRMCYISSHSSRRIRKFVTGSQLWDFKCQNQAHSLALCLSPACRSVTPLVPCMSASHHDDGQRLWEILN